jgi:hypothetical protein
MADVLNVKKIMHKKAATAELNSNGFADDASHREKFDTGTGSGGSKSIGKPIIAASSVDRDLFSILNMQSNMGDGFFNGKITHLCSYFDCHRQMIFKKPSS